MEDNEHNNDSSAMRLMLMTILKQRWISICSLTQDVFFFLRLLQKEVARSFSILLLYSCYDIFRRFLQKEGSASHC